MKKEITAAEAEARLAEERERLLARLKKVNAEKESIEKKLERYKVFAAAVPTPKVAYDLEKIKSGEPFEVNGKIYKLQTELGVMQKSNSDLDLYFKTCPSCFNHFNSCLKPDGNFFKASTYEIWNTDICDLARACNLTTKELYDALKK